MFNKELLKQYVAKYKENFDDIRYGKEHREIYKWEAVEHFKKHWSIDAPNFAEMLKEALAKTENLLTLGMFFAKGMILGFAEQDPEAVREMFKNLYDESIDLSKRVTDFTNASSKLKELSPEVKSHYQGTRAISVYLWLMYPEKYYIYQYGIYHANAKLLEADYSIKANGKPESMIEGFRFFDEVRVELCKDRQLIQLNLDNGVAGFRDEGLTTLTQDIAFFIKGQEDEWEPTLEEYDPQISVLEWKVLLDNKKVFDENALKVVSRMLALGGKATCKQLADKFGETYNFYNGGSRALAQRVQKEINCPMPPKRDDGTERYWPILYVGRNVKGDDGVFEWKLRDELKEALIEIGFPIETEIGDDSMPKHPKNLILYGPPGTGKTYNTVHYAVAIIENKTVDEIGKEDRKAVLDRYRRYREEGLVEFCTFHQSFGYEEFIEGIKPEMKNSNVAYDIVPGIFKSFCTQAELAAVGENEDFGIKGNPVIWKVSLMTTGDNSVREDCLLNNHVRIGYGDDLTEQEIMNTAQGILGRYVNEMQIGDIVVSCYTENEFDAIGVVIGECRVDNTYDSYKQVRDVKWLVKNIKEDIRAINDGKKMTLSTVYRLNRVALADILPIIKKYNKSESDTRNRVFIIDEINRGNISKIFGELITLIEDSKRIGAVEEMRTRLPYSGERFGVPDNVYLIGTMNTADRSIALIDTALRRRFKFVEMQPNAELLEGVVVDGIEVKKMFEMINNRIEAFYDREHTVGHSFFMALKKNPNIEVLADIFACDIIPLLKEYFYDDFEKIAMILGDDVFSSDKNKNFILRKKYDLGKYFKIDIELNDRYQFNTEALNNPEAYKKIYQGNGA